MEHHVDNTSLRGLLITTGLWVFAKMTASDIATYCTILSAIVTIVVNFYKIRDMRSKSSNNEQGQGNLRKD